MKNSQQQQQQKSIIEIYTDWANHYLDKLPTKRVAGCAGGAGTAGARGAGRIRDLRTELTDGLLLADVVEAVTGNRVPGIMTAAAIRKKPHQPNIQACLDFLADQGVTVGDVSAGDIARGDLKAILGLFFQLSRFKQQQKMLLQQQQKPQSSASGRGPVEAARCSTPKIPSVPPSPARSLCSTTSIPLPNSPIKKLPQPVTNNNNNNMNHSSGLARLGPRQHSASSIKPPSSMPSNPPLSTFAKSKTSIPSPSKNSSMLDKFKLRRSNNAKEAGIPVVQSRPNPPSTSQRQQQGLGKRTSSSSGFSSARSTANSSNESSSSSAASDTNFPSPSALRRISSQNSTFSPEVRPRMGPGSGGPTTPVKSKLVGPSPQSPMPQGPPSSPSRASPKRGSPKLSRATMSQKKSATELKDYGPIDRPSEIPCYPPHAKATSKIPHQHAEVSRIPSAGKGNNNSRSGLPLAKGMGMSRPSKAPVQQQQAEERRHNQNSGGKEENCENAIDDIVHSTEKSRPPGAVAQGCTVKPLPGVKVIQHESIKEEENETDNEKSNNSCTSSVTFSPQRNAPGNSGSSSLPKQKRLDSASNCATAPADATGASTNSHNVAVVSPMPSLRRKGASLDRAIASSSSSPKSGKKKKHEHGKEEEEDEEDPLKSVVPMAPLFRSPSAGCAAGMMHQMPTLVAYGAAIPGKPRSSPLTADGYLSDGDASFFRTKNQTSDHEASHLLVDDPGYLSEGGASFYARKIQNRIVQDEEEKRRSGLPEVLGGQGARMDDNGAIYRVVGGRKNVQKSEACMQTDAASAIMAGQQQQTFDWKKAMAHNARVLSSQEKAMDEYLRRQRQAAEQHIQQANCQLMQHNNSNVVRQQPPGEAVKTVENLFPASSVPATPTGSRRHNNGLMSNGLQHHRQAGFSPRSPGGSLERQQNRGKVGASDANYGAAFSDSEYGKLLLGSPMANRRSYAVGGANPPPPGSPGGKRDAIFGSRSLPKGASSLNYGLMVDRIQQKRQHRQLAAKANNDGSLSDSNYTTYSEIGRSGAQNYAWLGPASTYVHDPYAPWSNEGVGEVISTDVMGSNESLTSVSSSIQQARANSLTKARLAMHQQSLSPRSSLHRARHQPQNNNGSEMSFPSNASTSTTTTANENEYYGVPFRPGSSNFRQQDQPIHLSRFKSHPTSPSRDTLPSLPSSHASSFEVAARTAHDYSSLPCYRGKETTVTGRPSSSEGARGLAASGQAHGSSGSLASNGGGSVYSSQEAKTDADINKLRRELEEEHEKVANLTCQLATNSHVVAAFEQSLANMTARLQQLTTTSERKDAELGDLRRTIERLRQSGADAGLISQPNSKQALSLSRQQSTDSVVSVGSNSSVNQSGDEAGSTKPKRSGWLRHSFSKAFTKKEQQEKSSKKVHQGKPKRAAASKGGSMSDVEGDSITKMLYDRDSSSCSREVLMPPPQTPELHRRSASAASGAVVLRDVDAADGEEVVEVVHELKRQLQEKDSLLTETRLEALSSAHQLESLRETVSKMRNELMSLKSDNEKLQTIIHNKSLNSSQSSLNDALSAESKEDSNKDTDSNNPKDGSNKDTNSSSLKDHRRLSTAMSETSMLSGPSSLDLSGSTDPANRDGGKLVSVTVSCGVEHRLTVTLGVVSISGKSNWELLDSLVHRLFKEFVMRVDPASNLGLSADSVAGYRLGEVYRDTSPDEESRLRPEFLPYGYLVGDCRAIEVHLREDSVDALAFETLTPKSVVQRYILLLQEHHRLILSAPAGTGKTFMARRLASYLVRRDVSGGEERGESSEANTPTNNRQGTFNSSNSVVTFTVDSSNASELCQFLSRLSAQCAADAGDMNKCANVPRVVILDNLHHAGRLEEVFDHYLAPAVAGGPYIIGTLSSGSCQSGSAATGLQLRHGFRWVACASHAEPARGFLGRQLRRRLLAVETQRRSYDGEMARVTEWLAATHLKLNKFLEGVASGAGLTALVSLSPKHFLSCPMDARGARNWFVDLWNQVLVPQLAEAVREGLGLYGTPLPHWDDPVQIPLEGWPWPERPQGLKSIPAQDVGLEDVVAVSPPESNETSSSRPGSIGTDSIGSSSASANANQECGSASDPPKRTSGGQDPLFNMLMHLQDATVANNGQKRPQNN